MFTFYWVTIALLFGATNGNGEHDDSLRGAIDAVSQRQREVNDDGYYINRGLDSLRIRPDDIQFYDSRGDFSEDGQPEDIGYGYQKSVAPHTSGIFDPVALPNSELGVHNSLGNERPAGFLEKPFPNLHPDYSENNLDNRFIYKYPRNVLSPNSKRSIFRERGDDNYPETMQNLYPKHESNVEVDPSRPILIPSSFRERYPGKSRSPSYALAFVRNFGGLDRDVGPNADDDSDEYLNELNSIWEKFKNNLPDGVDPEELTDSDVEEIVSYFGGDKGNKKRFDSYDNGYDFFNSPLSWAKRNKQRVDSLSPSDGFFHALKFLSNDRDVLETLHDDDLPSEDNDEDIPTIVLEPKLKPIQFDRSEYRDPDFKTRPRMNSDFNEKIAYHNRLTKRFPVTKRSSNYIPENVITNIKQRQKKNVGSNELTDPKVTQEIKNIFSNSDSLVKDHNSTKTISDKENENATNVMKDTKNDDNKGLNKDIGNNNTKQNSENGHIHNMHRRDRETGQKEESGVSTSSKPLDLKKKSINWSEYFGIDRRKKKSVNNINNDWLINKYLKEFSLKGGKSNSLNENGRHNVEQDESFFKPDSTYTLQNKGQDDIDNKLKAMEDLIVDEAMKYTGAHEGITDSKEIQKVKSRILSKLNAAYSLEKMRRALGEFKSSIAAQKDFTTPSSSISTPKPQEKDDMKSKRIAVKKEKAEESTKDKKSIEDKIDYVPIKPAHSSKYKYIMQMKDDEVCPIMSDVNTRCREISMLAGDKGEVLHPFCMNHQICYLCGTEVGNVYPPSCDLTFLNEVYTFCHYNDQCRYLAKRMLAIMHAMKGDPSPAGCDWTNNPCLARFLAMDNEQ